MTLLYSNPHRKFTSKDLAEFINAYDFGIMERITTARIGAFMKSSHRGGYTFMTKIKKARLYNKDLKRYVMHYWVER